MQIRKIEPKPSWQGMMKNKRMLGRAEQWETISGVLGSPVVKQCKGTLEMSKLCVATTALRWKPADAFTGHEPALVGAWLLKCVPVVLLHHPSTWWNAVGVVSQSKLIGAKGQKSTLYLFQQCHSRQVLVPFPTLTAHELLECLLPFVFMGRNSFSAIH